MKSKTLLLSLLFLSLLSNAQVTENKILDAYKEFGVSTRELVYVHINKSTFLKNEMLGFNAYVLDKAKKVSLPLTTNLYCTISDKDNNIIKSKLVKAEDGFSYNIFKIDSLFTSGEYVFKAYTNWMLNFNERNYYEHSFLVIDPEIQKEIKKTTPERKYTIQVLPEGGHLVSDVRNNLGIIVKDQDGFGLANAEGKIVNSKNELITEFTLNQFGIEKVPMVVTSGERYQVIISSEGQEIKSNITNIEEVGISLHVVSDLRERVSLSFSTNSRSTELIKDKQYLLAIHNGYELKLTSFSFDGKVNATRIINFKDLYSGINIFTIFDPDKNIPILERMFFNPNGISKSSVKVEDPKISNDSITVELKLKDITLDPVKYQNLSVSVLPSSTRSYQFNSNIISQTYLEPYVKGYIQNASYYFSKDNAKVRYDLDNLLLTQGWSSYDWNDVFQKPSYEYKFEQGINVVANINGKRSEGFLAYPLRNNKSQIFIPSKSDKAFTHTNLFPLDDETYKVSLLKKNEKTEKPNLYVQFYPSEIPKMDIEFYRIPLENGLLTESISDSQNFQPSWNGKDIEVLDEVVLKAKVEATRMEKIKNSSQGQVEFFDDRMTQGGLTLPIYLSRRGFIARVNYSTGDFTITNPNPNTPNNATPLVILDGVQLLDFGILTNFQMDIVDYIEINKSGVGYGLRGGGGVITIVTNPVKRISQRKTTARYDIGEYKFPLTFSTPKKYYAPTYKNYTTSFFKEYGAIGWYPNLKFDEQGILTFKILNTDTPSVNLYMEGIVNDGTFVSETKTVTLQ